MGTEKALMAKEKAARSEEGEGDDDEEHEGIIVLLKVVLEFSA